MKKLKAIFLPILIALPAFVQAQSGEIEVSGVVREVATGKPLKSKITYKSVPTGSITGHFNDSTFRFTIFGSSKYQVTATAPNYIPKVVMVDPVTYAGKGNIKKDIILTPKGQSIRLDHLIFEVGKSTIDPTSFDELNEIAAMLIDSPDIVIQLEGHTDNTGSASANMKLSQERVDAVKKYLVSKKVNKNQVRTKAFGGTQPVYKGKSPEEKNLNRRVEMRVVAGVE